MAKSKKSPAPLKASPAKPAAPSVVLKDSIPMPPAQGAPSPPSKYKPRTRAQKGQRPPALEQQTRDAADVARELEAGNYVKNFGPRAPNPVQLVASLRRYKGWAEEEEAAAEWLAYVQAQRFDAWQDASTRMDTFEPKFRDALGDEPVLAKSYSQTLDFLSVHKVAAAKGVATKAAKKKKDPPAK